MLRPRKPVEPTASKNCRPMGTNKRPDPKPAAPEQLPAAAPRAPSAPQWEVPSGDLPSSAPPSPRALDLDRISPLPGPLSDRAHSSPPDIAESLDSSLPQVPGQLSVISSSIPALPSAPAPLPIPHDLAPYPPFMSGDSTPEPPALDSEAPDTDIGASLDPGSAIAHSLAHMDFQRRGESDSVPPSIPSAAAVLAPAEIPGSLSPVGSQALQGDVIANRYRIDAILGEGGMGIVYRCTDLSSQETVALKRVVVPDVAHAEEYVMWFYKEARALAALDHPSIVGARDFGRLRDGSPYLAMDLAPGASLHDLSHAGLNWPTIWHIVDQILGALAHAHARGIIHGDLKPSNVLIEEVESQPPLVHMLDFGLAWLKSDTHDERLDGEKLPEFKPHAGAGTPGYMAPEQIQHEQHHVCGATDLYSLGCILYRLLSRTPPFTGTPKELLRQHAYSEVPRLLPVFPIPEGVVDFVARLLEKKPWDRWEFAAGARKDWSAFRPQQADPQDFVLPRIRPSQVRPLPPGTGYVGRNPQLDADTERTAGLLNIRQSPLVGRQEIRQTLREICDEVIDGIGPPHRLIILVGPAGSGKSRIAEWLFQSVHEEGSMIPLWARYRPVRGPLDGIVGAVTRYYNFERADRDTIERSLLQRWHIKKNDKVGRTWVAGAAEWLRPAGPVTDAPLGPSGVRFTLDTLATRRTVSRHVVRRLGEGQKILFWLDDLHNASESTFEGFQRMHAEDADRSYVIVATVRAEEVHLGTPAAERLRQLREKMDGVAIDVTPLEPETTRELLKKSLLLEDDAVEEAARRSRGNPLFALQQLHAWALEGNMMLRDGVYRVPPEVLAVRPKTTAELWDSRLAAVPAEYRQAAYAIAAISSDLRREVLRPLLSALGLPPDDCIRVLQKAEILIPRGPGRYSWPHALLQEHLSAQLAELPDRTRIYRAAADALQRHPLAATRRVVRQRVMNLIQAGDPEDAALLLFDFLQHSWNGAREPLSTLSDLDLLRGKLQGRTRAHQDRWRAEALRHVGRAAEAREYAERSRLAFIQLQDPLHQAHTERLLGHICAELGNSSEGKKYAQNALSLFQVEGDVLGQAQTEAVLAEIDYLLGNFGSARAWVSSGETHFASLDQPLGRGQCLLLSSWIEHSEGTVERAKRLALEAREEFERVGYRLGTAQANTSLAHIEHRMMNLRNAEIGAQDALLAFEALRTPRGQAACRRLLAMIAIDIDEPEMATLNAEWSKRFYTDIDDPWGIVESKVLEAQVALLRRDLDRATQLLEEAHQTELEEPEPRQHLLLTEAWLYRELEQMASASLRLEQAMRVFDDKRRVGDHTVHLLARLDRYPWPEATKEMLQAWRVELRRPALPTLPPSYSEPAN